MSKIAIFFPGIGYTVDKPLLHYSRRIAAKQGYEIRLLPYAGFPDKVKGDRKKMVESFKMALRQTEDMLSDTDLMSYEEVLFVGKSVGTIAAAALRSTRFLLLPRLSFKGNSESFDFFTTIFRTRISII